MDKKQRNAISPHSHNKLSTGSTYNFYLIVGDRSKSGGKIRIRKQTPLVTLDKDKQSMLRPDLNVMSEEN